MDQEFIFLNKNNIDTFYKIFIEAKQDQNITYDIGFDRFNDYLLQLSVKEETSFLLKDNNEIIGVFISAVRGDNAYISAMAVLNKYRGMGYGRVLLQKGNLLLLENGCKKVILEVLEDNENAVKLYLSEGFKMINKIENLKNDKIQHYFKVDTDLYQIKKEDPIVFHILFKVFHKNKRPWQKQLTSVLQKIRNGNAEIYLIKKNNIIAGYFIISKLNNILQIEDFVVNENAEDIAGKLFSYFSKNRSIMIANSFYVDDKYLDILKNNGFYIYLRQYEMEKNLL